MNKHDTANKIMDVITEYGCGMVDDDYEYIGSEDVVERIIAIVREAMLGEHAMSVARGIEIDMEGAYGMSENAVPAMLDAIGFGESSG